MTAARGPDTRPLDPEADTSPAAAPAPDTRPVDAADAAPAGPGPGETLAGPGRPRWQRFAFAGLILLALAGAGSYLETLAAVVFQPAAVTEWIAAAGTLLLAAAAVLAAAKELRAVLRLRRLEAIRQRAEALLDGEVADDPAIVGELRGIYAGRPDVAPALRRFKNRAEGVGDAANQVAAFDAVVLAELDDRVERTAVAAVRRTATATALSPFALLDAGVAAWVNLRLIRDVASAYGGRPGAAATLRLLRLAFWNMLAAGIFENAQDALNDLVSEGVAGRVSTTMASAVTNGLLTARLAVAAIEVCRPVPRRARARTSPRRMVRRALSDGFASGMTGKRARAEAQPGE
jgi:putative membrane protein